jgi:hypothetical protein
MTKLLEKALEAVRQLSPDSQDEIARLRAAFADADRRLAARRWSNGNRCCSAAACGGPVVGPMIDPR